MYADQVLSWFSISNVLPKEQFYLPATAPPAVGHNITLHAMISDLHPTVSEDRYDPPSYVAIVGVYAMTWDSSTYVYQNLITQHHTRTASFGLTLYDMKQVLADYLALPAERNPKLFITAKVYFNNPYNNTQLLPLTSQHFNFTEHKLLAIYGSTPQSYTTQWDIREYSNTTDGYHLTSVDAPIEFVTEYRTPFSGRKYDRLALDSFFIPVFSTPLNYTVVPEVNLVVLAVREEEEKKKNKC